MRMRRNFVGEFDTSFFSCEKDAERIIKKLFVESRPYSDELKRLLLINTRDCLDNRTKQEYIDKIKETSVADLVDKGYIRMRPKMEFEEHQNVMNYIIITFDNFVPNDTNPHYRDCTIEIDVFSHIDHWDLGNFRQRPIKIVGYIDGILDECKLTGIGKLNFLSCKEVVLSEEIAGYCLMYRCVHGSDDSISPEE